jgi:acyl-CoA reductase-like NAD-dependent aldehyde dehydrogenase
MGSGRIIGQQLAKHPVLRAIGFTGSRAGGRALMDSAAARAVPIASKNDHIELIIVFIDIFPFEN